jgi:hypothetical protein
MNTNRFPILIAAAALLRCVIAVTAQNPGQVAGGAGRAGTPGDGLGFTDTPMLPGLPYHVHDPDRPHPRVVTPGTLPGAAPSDAIVLFDGKDLSQWTFERSGPGSRRGGAAGRAMTDEMRKRLEEAQSKQQASPPPLGWKLENGYVEVIPGAGQMVSKEKFGDVQVHVEFQMPENIQGRSQNRGNSGVLLQKRYEIQVFDSYRSPTYADGQAGAIYGQWPPLVNACRKPGEWQTYDIVFEAPKFEGDKLVKPAYFTVFQNGVLLHNRQASMGPMVYRQVANYTPQPAEDSLMLQNHNQPVRFRNIWVRRLGGYDDQPEK